MSSVILPGSYDPVTRGHLEIIARAAKTYDEVYVVAFVNPNKTYTFSVEERVKMLILATDEFDTDTQIDAMAKTLEFALESGHTAPQNFYGVGGMKIFRDLIYQMRGMMRADHKFYKKNGYYDFPQKKRLTSMKMYLVGALLSSEKIRKKMGNKMNEGMLMPYKKLFEKLDKQTNEKE